MPVLYKRLSLLICLIVFCFVFFNTGAAAAFQEDKMDHSHDEPDQSSPRMSWRYSELPRAKLLPRLKDDLSSSTSALQDSGVTNTNTERTRNFLDGYTNYLSDSEGSVSSSIDDDRDGDYEDNQEIKCDDDDKSDNGDDSLDDDDDNGDNDSDGDDDSDDNDDDDGNIDQGASYSCPDGNISMLSDKVNESLIQKSGFSLQDGSCNDENTNSDQNNVCRPPESSNNINIFDESVCVRNEESRISSECDDDAERFAVGGITPFTSKTKSPIVSVASNVTSPGARPKTSSQATVTSNEVYSDLPGGKIPSLDVIGISQGFLARHSTDQSLPYSASTEDLRTSQSTSSIDWHQTSVTSNENSSASWNVLELPFLERDKSLQGRAYPRRVQPWYGNPRNVCYQPVTQMTGLGSGWQLPNQQQPPSGRTGSDCLPENQRMSNRAGSCLTYQDEPLSHLNGHFVGDSGTQGGDSFNRQAWMPGNYETSWPRYDYNTYQTNPSSFGEHAVTNDPVMNLPAINPSATVVTLPNVTLPSATLNLQTAASTPVTSQSSSSTALSGNDNLHLSQATTSTEDDSLVALERKVAEACSLVERVLKEREERTKRQREEMQRQREIREQRQREAREMREKEEREMREREEREAREEMAGVERAPVQESPLWQCEHYQRRCSVRFPCCEVFYPCHRCHNGSGACDSHDKKANQATHVKCASCGYEEEVSGLLEFISKVRLESISEGTKTRFSEGSR